MNTLRKPEQPLSSRRAQLVGVALAAVLLSACASMPPPIAEMAVSKAAVAHAVTAGSTELAPVEMRAATEKMARADAAMAAKDYPLALSLAREAQVDARLAEAKTDASKAAKVAAAAREDNRVLSEELSRKSK